MWFLAYGRHLVFERMNLHFKKNTLFGSHFIKPLGFFFFFLDGYLILCVSLIICPVLCGMRGLQDGRDFISFVHDRMLSAWRCA